jgi:hypothetical protein
VEAEEIDVGEVFLIGGGRYFWYIFWKTKLIFLDVDGNLTCTRLINISIE